MTATLLRAAPPPRGDVRWWEHAACARHPHPDWWTCHTVATTTDNEAATRICRRQCTVRRECLIDAVDNRATAQICGGMRMPGETQAWIRSRRAQRLRELVRQLKGVQP